MLHRSPSGAQRKIRQRREEMNQQRQSSTPSSSSIHSQPSAETETLIDLEYRSLVDSSAYRSILDDMSYKTDIGSNDELFKDKIAINTFSKPEPARRTLGSIDRSNNSNGSTDKYNSAVSLETTQNSFTNQIYGGPGKPTVEVHPMPAPRSIIPSSQQILPQKVTSIPPPIPKKPEKLKKKSNQNSLSSDYQDEMSISVSPNENELPREKPTEQDSETSSESAVVIERNPRCASKPCSSTEALDRLYTSNLVRSMEEKFDDARLSAADISELEKRRLISINKLINKVAERSADLNTIKVERQKVMSEIQNLLGNHQTRPRIEKEIRMRAHLIQLEGIARLRLQHINNLMKEHGNAFQDRANYWHDKIKDVRYLAIFVSQRITEIEDEIHNFLSRDEYTTYKKCMDLLIELDAENTETEEKLAVVQKQIEQLQNICPLSGGNKD